MGKIDELIQRYCPEGVEYVRLGDVVSISRGASPRPIQNYLTTDESGIPWIKIGDVSTNSKYITSTDERITREGANKSRFLKKGTFILSNSMSFGRPYILGIDGCIHDGWISICDFEASLNSDFLYYLLRSSDVQGYWISKANSGGAVANLNSDIVRSTPIPLPPLPVQEEIVNILDRFTVYAAELQAELQARQQQYNYYRDTLLSFEGREDVQWKKLGEVASIKTGRRFVRTDIRESGVPCFHYGDIYTYYGLTATKTKGYLDAELASKLRFAQPNDVVVVCAGENDMDIGIGVAWLGDEPAVIHDACCILHHEQNPRYISHFLRTHNYHLQMKRYVKNGKISSLPASGLAEALIPIPSLEEQEKIANILDRFDHLTNDLSQGLPAEIEARQQQYEYYRDQLLTFKRKEA
jgi:type I restriction enzyme S subunit